MQPIPSTSTSSDNIDRKVLCSLCGDKKYKTLKLLNQHKTRYHKVTAAVTKKQFIVCPLCEERTEMKTHEDLNQHIENTHDKTIEVITLQFFSLEELETWTKSEKIETMYAKHRINQMKTHKVVYYHCNKSDIKGYVPKYEKYTEKAGGTIRMKGVCPSRLKCNLYSDGKATVTFWKTHVGHDVKEVRSEHLSSVEKDMVVQKLRAGVPSCRILEDARKMEKQEVERINLLNYKDLAYLQLKRNIVNKRDNKQVVASALKVQEAHKEAKKMQNKAELSKDAEVNGRYMVKSCSDSKIYMVSLRQVCESECRTSYCQVCKICIHRYECNCPEYTVRNTLCKHVHLVCMYEEHMDTNSVADNSAETLGESSIIKTQNEVEVCQFIEEVKNCEITSNEDGTATDRDKRNAQLEYYFNWAKDLQDEDFAVFINRLQLAKEDINLKRSEPTKKRKMGRKDYFPSKKVHK